MDPNANLKSQESLLATCAANRRMLRELREALIGWIRNGGFAPDWDACPRAAKYFGIKAGARRMLGLLLSRRTVEQRQ